MDSTEFDVDIETALDAARVLAACAVKYGAQIEEQIPGQSYGFHVVVTQDELDGDPSETMPEVKVWRDEVGRLHVEARWQAASADGA